MADYILSEHFVPLIEQLLRLLPAPLSPKSRFFWAYILLFVGICFIRFYCFDQGPAKRRGLMSRCQEFVSYCFPKKIYAHQSAILDYKIYFLNQLVSPVFSLAKWWSAAVIASTTSAALAGWFGMHVQYGWTDLRVLTFSLLMFLVSDLATYVNHRMHHELALLWPFHSVHHSAEVLTPVTVYRRHPLYDLMRKLAAALFIGLFQGVVIYFFAGQLEPMQIFGMNLFYYLLFLPLNNLRHSHIWVSYGWYLNHILISPAQHQIHHSCLPRHINKNYGEVFAVWDWMFGTLYVPRQKEELVLGLGGHEAQPHATVAAFYWQPFVDLSLLIANRVKPGGSP